MQEELLRHEDIEALATSNGWTEMYAPYLTRGEIEPPTDPLGPPTLFARERIRAARLLLEQHCNGPAVAKQLALAEEALDLADHYAARPRPIRAIRGWEGV
jgi:hypothetical protein